MIFTLKAKNSLNNRTVCVATVTVEDCNDGYLYTVCDDLFDEATEKTGRPKSDFFIQVVSNGKTIKVID